MTRLRKTITGIITILPLLYVAFFMFSVFSSIAMEAGSKGESFIFKHFGAFAAIHGLVMLLQIGLIIYYMVFIFRSSAVKQEMKVLWAVVIFMGNIIAMPIFWYIFFFKAPRGEPILDQQDAKRATEEEHANNNQEPT